MQRHWGETGENWEFGDFEKCAGKVWTRGFQITNWIEEIRAASRFMGGLVPGRALGIPVLREVPEAKTRYSVNLKISKPPVCSSQLEDSKNAIGFAVHPTSADLHRLTSVWPCLRAGFSAQRTPGHHFLQLHRPTVQAHQRRFLFPKKRSNPERRLFSETQFSNSSIPQFLHYPLTSRGSFAADPPPGGAAQRLLRSGVTAIRPPRLQMRFFLITVISKQDFQAGSSEKKPWGPAARE